MIQANDTGRDLEHCNALTRKLDFVDDQRVFKKDVGDTDRIAEKVLAMSSEDTGRDFGSGTREVR